MPTSVCKASLTRKASLTPEALFADNQRLVGHVLSTHFARLPPEEREDSESWGRIGLWSAANKFDARRGYAFSTYALATIRGYILRGLTRDKGRNPPSCVSLDAPMASGSEGFSLAETLGDPESGVEAALSRISLTSLMSGLPTQQRRLMTAVYAEGHSVPEVAASWGVTRQAAWLLHGQAIRQLRRTLGPQMPSAFSKP